MQQKNLTIAENCLLRMLNNKITLMQTKLSRCQ